MDENLGYPYFRQLHMFMLNDPKKFCGPRGSNLARPVFWSQDSILRCSWPAAPTRPWRRTSGSLRRASVRGCRWGRLRGLETRGMRQKFTNVYGWKYRKNVLIWWFWWWMMLMFFLGFRGIISKIYCGCYFIPDLGFRTLSRTKQREGWSLSSLGCCQQVGIQPETMWFLSLKVVNWQLIWLYQQMWQRRGLISPTARCIPSWLGLQQKMVCFCWLQKQPELNPWW